MLQVKYTTLYLSQQSNMMYNTYICCYTIKYIHIYIGILSMCGMRNMIAYAYKKYILLIAGTDEFNCLEAILTNI